LKPLCFAQAKPAHDFGQEMAHFPALHEPRIMLVNKEIIVII